MKGLLRMWRLRLLWSKCATHSPIARPRPATRVGNARVGARRHEGAHSHTSEPTNPRVVPSLWRYSAPRTLRAQEILRASAQFRERPSMTEPRTAASRLRSGPGTCRRRTSRARGSEYESYIVENLKRFASLSVALYGDVRLCTKGSGDPSRDVYLVSARTAVVTSVATRGSLRWDLLWKQ